MIKFSFLGDDDTEQNGGGFIERARARARYEAERDAAVERCSPGIGKASTTARRINTALSWGVVGLIVANIATPNKKR